MKKKSKIIKAGRQSGLYEGIVNPPVIHASTILAENLEEFEKLGKRQRPFMDYGRKGTTTSFVLEEALVELEGGKSCLLYPSGLAAVAGALLSVVKANSHLLMADSVYYPTRKLCDSVIKRMGVEIEYYDPMVGSNIEQYIKKNTVAIYTESPGSLTFEVQDIQAISSVANKHGIKVLLDNTWATPLFFKPFDHGVDLSIQSATKYISGHSDVLLGAVISNEKNPVNLQQTTWSLGYHSSPDDIYLCQRGLRTLGVRMDQHQSAGLKIARWLTKQPEVIKVMHPGLQGNSNYDIWKKDFLGASSLFGFVISNTSRESLEAMVNDFKFFAMGASWGGYESLCIPTWPNSSRTVTRWPEEGQTFRIHVGLEDPDDLILDLRNALNRL